MRMLPGYKNCGPVELETVTGRSYDEIIANWPGGWKSPTKDTGKLGVPNDTPADHFVLLEKLGIPYRKVDIDMLFAGQCKIGKTALLVHLVKKPKNRWEAFKNFFFGCLYQHWVVLHDISPDKKTWFLDWGTSIEICGQKVPEIKAVDIEYLETLLLAGWPYCVYEVGVGDNKTGILARCFAKITGRYI